MFSELWRSFPAPQAAYFSKWWSSSVLPRQPTRLTTSWLIRWTVLVLTKFSSKWLEEVIGLWMRFPGQSLCDSSCQRCRDGAWRRSKSSRQGQTSARSIEKSLCAKGGMDCTAGRKPLKRLLSGWSLD
jgi:hypothetical protein